jgi:hypothetical protein
VRARTVPRDAECKAVVVTDTFDFEAFRRAFVGKDAGAWAAFYADDAEWLEYRHTNPPRSPNRMVGRDAIAAFVTAVSSAPLTIDIADDVVSDERIAFSVTATFPDGRRIIEHVIAEHRDGRIVRQVDVEAWD